jgi:hypothetical protein
MIREPWELDGRIRLRGIIQNDQRRICHLDVTETPLFLRTRDGDDEELNNVKVYDLMEPLDIKVEEPKKHRPKQMMDQITDSTQTRSKMEKVFGPPVYSDRDLDKDTKPKKRKRKNE